MPTPAQEMFAEAFGELVETHSGTSLWTFGGYSFAGVLAQLRADDPRLLGANGRLCELIVSAEALPAGVVRGSFMSFEGTVYTVTRSPSRDQSTGLTTLLLSLP
jgi:hypothetical protein